MTRQACTTRWVVSRPCPCRSPARASCRRAPFSLSIARERGTVRFALSAPNLVSPFSARRLLRELRRDHDVAGVREQRQEDERFPETALPQSGSRVTVRTACNPASILDSEAVTVTKGRTGRTARA